MAIVALFLRRFKYANARAAGHLEDYIRALLIHRQRDFLAPRRVIPAASILYDAHRFRIDQASALLITDDEVVNDRNLLPADRADDRARRSSPPSCSW